MQKRLNRSICRFGCGLGWAEGSISSIVFARWRQCAVMGRHFGATWRIQMSRPSAAAMRLYVKLFLCMLPMSVARSSSGMLTIGRIAYQREGGDGSAQRVRSVIYGCLVRYCSSIVTMSLSYTVYKLSPLVHENEKSSCRPDHTAFGVICHALVGTRLG